MTTLEQTPAVLTGMPVGGKMLVTRETEEQFVFAAPVMTKLTKAQVFQEQRFIQLQGQSIALSDASKKYQVPRGTLYRWLSQGFITVLQAEPVQLVDEADVAYVVWVYRQRRFTTPYGVPLLDSQGDPYQLKHPDLSEYRRRKKN